MEEKNQEMLLAQWQTCVEMANAVSERRDTMNNLFVSLNLAVFAAISFLWTGETVVLCIAGCSSCAVWLLFIRYFRQLNSAKYEIIGKIEEQLPVKAFSDEWAILHNKKRYFEGTQLDKILPWVFLIIYGVILLMSYCAK